MPDAFQISGSGFRGHGILGDLIATYQDNKMQNQTLQGQNEGMMGQLFVDQSGQPVSDISKVQGLHNDAKSLIEELHTKGTLPLAKQAQLSGYLSSAMNTRKYLQEQEALKIEREKQLFDLTRTVNQYNAQAARFTGQPQYQGGNLPSVNPFASPAIRQSLAPQAPQAPQGVPSPISQYGGQPQAAQPAQTPMVPGGGMLRTDAPTPQASNLSQYATPQVPSGVGNKALGLASFGGGSGFNTVIPHLVSALTDYGALTGQMLPEAVQTKIAEKAMGVKKAVGWVKSGEEEKNGQWYSTYNPVYQTADGSNEVSDTGKITQFSDMPFTLGQQIKQGVGGEWIPDKPQENPNPTKIRYTKEQRDGLNEASGDLQVVNAAGEDLKNAILANRKLNEARISRFAGITGNINPLMNFLGDTTGSNFDSISSKFVGALMGGEKGGGVKNIRNLQEFKAVTASIPKSDQPEDIRRDRLNEAAVRYTLSKKRLEATIKYLKSGLSEGEARTKANEEVKQLGIEDSINEIVGSLAGKPLTEGQQIARRVSGVVGGIPFVGKKMAAAVERTAADNPNVKTPSGWSFNP